MSDRLRDEIARTIAHVIHYPEAFEQGDPERIEAQYEPAADAVLVVLRPYLKPAEPEPELRGRVASIIAMAEGSVTTRPSDEHAAVRLFQAGLIRGASALEPSTEAK